VLVARLVGQIMAFKAVHQRLLLLLLLAVAMGVAVLVVVQLLA
jgi:hypothetical protein